MLRCVGTAQFVYPPADSRLGSLRIFCYDRAAVNVRVQVLVEHVFSILFGVYLGVEFLGPRTVLCVTCWGTAKLSFKAAASFCILWRLLGWAH